MTLSTDDDWQYEFCGFTYNSETGTDWTSTDISNPMTFGIRAHDIDAGEAITVCDYRIGPFEYYHPNYYAFWSFTQNLSDTTSVTKMTPGTDIPDGYAGYLFHTGTITRAVVWFEGGTSNDLCIQTSGTGSDYVRIVRSEYVLDPEVSGAGDDYGGLGWAICYDNGKCEEEDGSDVISDWSTAGWDDQGGDDGKYKITYSLLYEPIMIWADHDQIVLTSS